LGSAGNLNTDLINIGAKLGYRFFSESRINPVVYFGLGVFNFKTGNSARFWDGYGAIGGGAELFVTNYLGLNLTTDFRYTTGDDFDASHTSTAKDAFLNLAFGLNYYFGGRGKAIPDDPVFTDNEGERDIQIEEVPEEDWEREEALADRSPATSQAAAYDPLTELKEKLLIKLAEKDREIRLLTAKLNAFEKRRVKLELQVGDQGSMTFISRTKDVRAEQLRRRLQAALDYFAVEDYEDAILSFKSILYEDPDGPLATTCWYWLGECHFNRGEFYAGIESFELAAVGAPVGSPKSEVSQVMLALSRWRLGEHGQAKARLEKILANISNSDFGPIVHEYLNELNTSGRVESTN